MGNFWSDKNHEKKPPTPESREKTREWQKRQNDIRSGKIDLHPEIKLTHQPLYIVKHNPHESREAKRKRIQEARSIAIKNMLNKYK